MIEVFQMQHSNIMRQIDSINIPGHFSSEIIPTITRFAYDAIRITNPIQKIISLIY